MMIILGPILIFLSGMLVIVSSEREWTTVLDEEDFEYDYWDDAYSATATGRQIDDQLKVYIRSKNDTSVSITFWVEDEWGYDEFSDRGYTPEVYEVDLGYVTYYEDYEFFISINDEGYDIEDLDVSIQKNEIPSSFIGFCAMASLLSILGLLLLVLGIIFTVVYTGRIKEQDPEFIRQEMIRKQESMMREHQVRKAREMDRIRQRQAMLIRARNLESAFRLDEAAYMYERLDMYEDAGRCRRKKREEVSRHIHVDANEMFDQLQKKGTALPYLCPRCHGMVDIDGDKHRHEKCPYCGAMIDFQTLKRAAGNLLQ
jgi:rubrerythrin